LAQEIVENFVAKTSVKAHQFLALDGLRGMVALVVLGFHLVQQRDL